MTKKQPHVPETREARPNREQRRHPEKLERPEDQPLERDEQPPQDQLDSVADPRLKTGGHKKKTADNWNQ